MFTVKFEIEPCTRYAEREVDRSSSVGDPIASFGRTRGGGAFPDGHEDRVGVMAGQPQAHRDLGIEARWICLRSGRLANNILEMETIRFGDRIDRGSRNRRALDPSTLSAIRDCLLQLRIRDLEPVFRGLAKAKPDGDLGVYLPDFTQSFGFSDGPFWSSTVRQSYLRLAKDWQFPRRLQPRGDVRIPLAHPLDQCPRSLAEILVYLFDQLCGGG
jgi:hypothetical protein